MPIATRRIISIYLLLHPLLMLVESLIMWLPVFFILYGGIQAVVLRTMLKKKPEYVGYLVELIENNPFTSYFCRAFTIQMS